MKLYIVHDICMCTYYWNEVLEPFEPIEIVT